MGIVGLKVTESRQVIGPTMFSFKEEKELSETTERGFEKPSPRLFEIKTPKQKKSKIEELMGV